MNEFTAMAIGFPFGILATFIGIALVLHGWPSFITHNHYTCDCSKDDED